MSQSLSSRDDKAVPRATRAYHTKVRTGCRTCKWRKIKCTEEKPFCRKCTSTGRKCDGYDNPPQSPQLPAHAAVTVYRSKQPRADAAADDQSSMHHSTRESTYKSRSDGQWQPNLTVSPSAFPDLKLSATQSKAFEFFMRRTIHDLTGPFEHQIWKGIVMPLCNVELSVLHAATALGMCHMKDTTPHTGLVSKAAILEQYNNALNHLAARLQILDEHTRLIALVTCLLFIAIDSMSGRPSIVHHHIDLGLRIGADVTPYTASTQSATQEQESLLITKLTRIGNTTSFYQDRPPVLANDDSLDKPFGDMHAAMTTLSCLTSVVYWFKKHGSLPHNSNSDALGGLASREICRNRLLQFLSQWGDQFDGLLQWKTLQENSRESKHAALVLKIQHAMLNIITKAAHKGSMAFDALADDFTDIVLLSRDTKALDTPPGLPGVSLDVSTVPALLQTALKCRDPQLRREAAELIAVAPRHGLWDRRVAAKLAWKAIEIEESGLNNVTTASDVPPQSRFDELHLTANIDAVTGEIRCERITENGEVYVETHVIDLNKS